MHLRIIIVLLIIMVMVFMVVMVIMMDMVFIMEMMVMTIILITDSPSKLSPSATVVRSLSPESFGQLSLLFAKK